MSVEHFERHFKEQQQCVFLVDKKKTLSQSKNYNKVNNNLSVVCLFVFVGEGWGGGVGGLLL